MNCVLKVGFTQQHMFPDRSMMQPFLQIGFDKSCVMHHMILVFIRWRVA